MRRRMIDGDLHTVCQEAGCPNIFECWEDREATFLIGGDHCTRRCDFCQIESAKPEGYDKDEPRRVAESVKQMGLRYATVTSVCRDDLEDEGAWLCAETIRQIHQVTPGVGVEMLAQDFSGKQDLLDIVFEARPEVFGHNLETVPRIFKRIRPGFRYDRSLAVLDSAHEAGLITKSNLILGMGETREEISQAMRALHDANTDLLTITQYLRPNSYLHPIDRWVTPQEFDELAEVRTPGTGALSRHFGWHRSHRGHIRRHARSPQQCRGSLPAKALHIPCQRWSQSDSTSGAEPLC